MSGEREQVDVHRFDIDGQMADRLHRVGVEEHLVRLADRADLGNRFHRADLVVRHHDADEDGFGRERLFHLLCRHPAVFVYRQIGHGEALFFQRGAGVQNRVVLDGGGDDMLALGRKRVRYALERPVIRFRTAGGKIDFLFLCADGRRHLTAGLFQRLLRLTAKGVNAGRVAVDFGHDRQGSLHRLGADAGRRRVVQVDSFHKKLTSGPKSFS